MCEKVEEEDWATSKTEETATKIDDSGNPLEAYTDRLMALLMDEDVKMPEENRKMPEAARKMPEDGRKISEAGREMPEEG